MKNEFVVQISSAKMPRSCWGRYVHVAVLEVVPGYVPRAIDARPAGVVRIVERWDRRHEGKTARCASARAIAAATALAAELNGTPSATAAAA